VIIILTRAGDSHADAVAKRLQERGVATIRFDPADFPAQAAATVAFTSTGPARALLRHAGTEVDLAAVDAIWFRRPAAPVAHPAIDDPLVRTYVEEESTTFVDDIWESLRCRIVPARRSVVRRAQLKATQLGIAADLGFELPPTLFTNDPDELLAFYREHNGDVVTKTVGQATIRTADEVFGRHTEVVSKRDIGYVRTLRYCPIIAQAYVPKRVELRVTVVGRRVFAAEIHSQASNHSRHDSRRYEDGRTPYAVHRLPDSLEARCVALVDRLGQSYGALDLILTPDGRYVFLEINPNGQFLWIEHETGLPIVDAICDLLCGDHIAVPPQFDEALALGGAVR